MKTIKILTGILVFSMAITTLNAQEKENKKTEEVTFITSIDCEGCVNTVMDNLPQEKGVKNVVCDLETKKVTITYKKDKTDPEKLKRTLEKLGYTAKKVEDEKKQ
jgi:copper chaperone CopZ